MGGGTQAVLSRAHAQEHRHVADELLVERVRAGDDEAFEELYRRYRRRIAGFAYGMVGDHARAEDIAQEAFMSALRRMRETDRPIAFRPWIHEIARNACIDQFRRAKRADEIPFESDEGALAQRARLGRPDAAPDAALDNKERLRQLCGAFGGLSDSHHEILVLRELEGLSYREIGDRMGLSRPAVESTLFRARRRLTEEYDELQSGRRCDRVQAALSEVAESGARLRDRRRVDRHLAHCQPCRRHAHLLGVSTAPARTRLRERVAALLPIPLFLRRRTGGRGSDAAASGPVAAHGHSAADWSLALGSSLEPAAGWMKAAAAAATLALASVGAGVATRHATTGAPAKRPAPSAPASSGGGSSGAAATSGFDQRPFAATPAPARVAGTGESARGHARGDAGGSAPAPAATGGDDGSGAPASSAPAAAPTVGGAVEKVTGGLGRGGGDKRPAPALPEVKVPPLPGVQPPAGAPQLPGVAGEVTKQVGYAVDQGSGTVGNLVGG
jgi:RNA polymerase sigma factor (sigma-70 family)